MSRTILVAIAAGGLFSASGASTAQQTVWTGVYTEAQATQGAALYATHCASCHGTALGGGESVPPLRGVAFGTTWEGLALSDLFDRLRKTMPPGKSGVMTRTEYASVLAFLLKMNDMPAGSGALASDAATLSAITFKSHKP
jgi:mono/diheme cytochrome c family protein